MNRIKIGGICYFCLGSVALAVLSACGETPSAKKVSAANEPESEVSSRALNGNAIPNLTLMFGNGYVTPSATGITVEPSGFLGSVGGFGFNGSIASLLGNLGGGGLGGFGAFANAFVGSLPTSPVGGAFPTPIPGAGAGAGAGAGTGGGGFGLPVGTAPPPGAGVALPVGGGFVPPTFGGAVPALPFATPFSTLQSNSWLSTKSGGQVSLVDVNLNEFVNPLASNLNLVFVVPNVRSKLNDGVSAAAVTDTVTPCAGGGTMTRSVNDVVPVGFSTGDSRSTTFASCIQRLGGTVVTNGSRSFTADLVQGVPFVDPVYSVNTSISVNNLSRTDSATSASKTENGTSTTNVDVTATNVSHNAAGNGTMVRTNTTGTTNVTYTFDMTFSLDKVASTFSMGFNSTINKTGATAGDTVVSTPTPFTGARGASPTAGVLRVEKTTNGVPSSLVVVTAQADGTAIVQTDTNGDGIFDTTETVASWIAIGQAFGGGTGGTGGTLGAGGGL